MTTTTKLITYEDSLTMPENKLEEIVDGESRIMPPPTPEHWNLLEELEDVLKSQLLRRDYKISSGHVGLGITRLPILTYRIPDIAVFAMTTLGKERVEKKKGDIYVWTVPELVAECLSPSNRKGSTEKLRQNYESIGVPEVWFIDPQSQTLTIHILDGGSLVAQPSVREGIVSPARLPQVSVNVDELWKAFDF